MGADVAIRIANAYQEILLSREGTALMRDVTLPEETWKQLAASLHREVGALQEKWAQLKRAATAVSFYY
jgi:hypothetical protein